MHNITFRIHCQCYNHSKWPANPWFLPTSIGIWPIMVMCVLANSTNKCCDYHLSCVSFIDSIEEYKIFVAWWPQKDTRMGVRGWALIIYGPVIFQFARIYATTLILLCFWLQLCIQLSQMAKQSIFRTKEKISQPMSPFSALSSCATAKDSTLTWLWTNELN